jgi:hypothetical protein
MFIAPDGLAARFKYEEEGTSSWTLRRVVAFDDDWQPLVISDDRRLELAGRGAGFDGIIDVASPNREMFTAIMPAGGWRVEFADPDGSKWLGPLVGWGIRDGVVVPLIADRDGEVDDLKFVDVAYRIYHPDQDPEPPEKPEPEGST